MFICFFGRASDWQVYGDMGGVIFCFYYIYFSGGLKAAVGGGRWEAAALTRVERTKAAKVCKYIHIFLSAI